MRNGLLLGRIMLPTVERGSIEEMNSSPLDPEGLLFQGNDYWATPASHGGALVIRWEGSVYDSLDAWRVAAGQEKLGERNTGLSVDPMLTASGRGGTAGRPDRLRTLRAYRLQPGSPLAHAGLNLRSLFRLEPGPTDFCGNPAPPTGPRAIGAHQPP